MRPHDDTSAPTIQVIGRMFALLEVLAAQAQPVALKLLAERTGLHPSTAHRILNDLAWGGLVERPSSGHYALGPKFISLGRLSLSRVDLQRAAAGPVKALQQALHLPVSLLVAREGRLTGAADAASESSALEASAAGRALSTGSAVGQAVIVDPDGEGFERLAAMVRNDEGRAVAVLAVRCPATADQGAVRSQLPAAAETIARALGWIPGAAA